MTPSDDARLPIFAGGDIVRLYAATYLPICRSLHQAGLIDSGALAREITARVLNHNMASWTSLALALAQVLKNDAAPKPTLEPGEL